MYVKFIGHYFHLRMTGSANFLQKVGFATEEIKYMEKITLEMPLLAFCVCVCVSLAKTKIIETYWSSLISQRVG